MRVWVSPCGSTSKNSRRGSEVAGSGRWGPPLPVPLKCAQAPFVPAAMTRTAHALYEGCLEYGSKTARMTRFTCPSCIGTKILPRPTPRSTHKVPSILPRRLSTHTRCPSFRPRSAASSGSISTLSEIPESARRTAERAVRVPVCHSAELPRPVSITSGYSASGGSGFSAGASKQNSARPSGRKKRPSSNNLRSP